ncbi:MAG: mercuric reductase [Elusimicrobia bacterium]|nr:mercuric reductase [Elusimicrobiota bacterium]
MTSSPPPILPACDRYDQALLANVHPADWKNPDPAPRYNLVVLGAGTAGLVTAAGAAGLGAKVALVEKHLLGGDCLNVGCVPSKALLRAARAFAEARDAEHFGVKIDGDVRPDFPAIMERMRRLRSHISRNDSVHRYRSLGVDVFLGEARFLNGETVEVEGKKLRFRRAVIATGARAALPPIPGLQEAGCLTNETLFSLTQLPKRLAVIGAGPIGCEMSQAFRRFGSEVFLVEVECQILTREDPDAARIVEKAFQRDGIETLCEVQIQKVLRRGNAKVLELKHHGKPQELEVDEILLGVGRAPNTEGLNLEAAGVEYGRRGVHVNDYLQTSNPHIYAAGDICLPFKFTHAADATARLVLRNALFMGRGKLSALTIPWCTYTDPEIAHVGLYEKDARDRGIQAETFIQKLEEVDRAILDGESEGLLKVHVKKGTGKILGATLVARHAGETISEITLALQAGLGLKVLAETIHPYPTQAEAIRKAADAYNRSRLTPRIKRLFQTWFAWRR